METTGVRPSQVRRALARVERGAAIDPAEATALLDARGAQLDELCSVAARVRDAGLVAAGQLQRSGRDMFLSPDEILAIASQGRGTGLPRGAVHPWRPAGDLPCLTSHALQRVLDAAARHHSAVLADRSGTGSTPLTTAPGCLARPPFGEGSLHLHRHVATGDSPVAADEHRARCDADTKADLGIAFGIGVETHTAQVIESLGLDRVGLNMQL